MTYAPKTLLNLRDFLRTATGLSAVELGIVGDSSHVRGYHCGRDRIFSASGIGWDDYSVKTTRDKNGLSDAASAMDIGMFDRLRDFSVWLVTGCRANALGTTDIREVIYSPDGKTVLRWDRERGVSSPPRTGEADDSHLTHTHISWYRDSETREKIVPFRLYFDSIKETEEPPMIPVALVGQPIGIATVKRDQTHYAFDLQRRFVALAAGELLNVYAAGKLQEAINNDPGTDRQSVYLVSHRGVGLYVLQSDVEFKPDWTVFNAGVDAAVTNGIKAKR